MSRFAFFLLLTLSLAFNVVHASQSQVVGSQYTYHHHRELPDAIANKSYTREIVIPHLPTDRFQLLVNQTLPAGLTLDPVTGVISGIPTVSGPNTFAVQVGSLTYVIHLMVMPAGGETLAPAYYDGQGPYAVTQETTTISFAAGELPYTRALSAPALISYPALAGNGAQLAAGRFPVISWMHGNSYQGTDYTQVLKIISSYGFIVIAPTRPQWDGATSSVWYEWQIYQRRGYETLLQLDLSSASKYFGHVNRDAIGLVGHSWGGATTELNVFQSPARAFVFIDDMSLLNNVDEWNNYFQCFSQPHPFPANPLMILKGGISSYTNSCIEFEGAFTGPRFMATFNNALHENFLNVGWNYQFYSPVQDVSDYTLRNSAHHIVSFFKRYLLDDVGAGANLYTPFALQQAGSISPYNGALAAVRPGWAGQLMIDDFSSSSLITNKLGLPVTSSLNTSLGIPYLNSTTAPNTAEQAVVAHPQYQHLHITQTAGAPPGAVNETLGDVALPLDASFYNYVAFEISQKGTVGQSVPSTFPLTIQLRDATGASAEMPLTLSVPVGGFKSVFAHSILLPLSAFGGVNPAKLVSLAIKLGTPVQDLNLELDNLRFERVAAAGNLPPSAVGQSVTTSTNTAKSIVLAATDPNGDALSYSVVLPPAHGTVSLAGNTVTYTPAAGYQGTDVFQFQASDGRLQSNTAVVNVTVIGADRPPVANNQSVTTPSTTAVNFTLTATDPDSNPLTYSIVTVPRLGGLTGTLPNLIYTPYVAGGTDSFTFKANDGIMDGNTATVSITITPVNSPPYANNSNLATYANHARAIQLSAGDPDNNPLTYTISSPAHGSLSGTPPNLTYSPALNYTGSDAFTFSVSDGKASSAPAIVNLTIHAANSAPTCNSSSAAVQSGYPVVVYEAGSDVDGDPLTYSIISGPAHGTFSGPIVTWMGNALTYTPNAGFVGTDTITYKVNDGVLDSTPGTLTFTVTLPELPPVAAFQALSTPDNVPLPIALFGTDPNNDPLYFEVLTQPLHGVLTGTPPNLIYTPTLYYSGPDAFLFRIGDGKLFSAAGMISITVSHTNIPPTVAITSPVNNASFAALSPIVLTATAGDVDGTVSKVDFYQGTTLIGTATSSPFKLTWNSVPAGTYSLTAVATDNSGATTTSAIVTVTSAKTVPVVSWSNPAAVVYGTALSATQLNATTSVPGTFVYTPASGVVLNAGAQTLSVTFKPTDVVNYTNVTQTVTLTVNKAPLTITADAKTKKIGAPLPALTASYSGFVNNDSVASLSIAATLTTTATAASPAGTYPVNVSGVVSTNYAITYVAGTLTVTNLVVPTITWANPAAITAGTALSATQLNATASVPGTFVYTPASGTVLSAGTQTLSVTFTPTNTTAYSTATATVSILVNKVTPIITWTNPAAITFGTALGATQLSASANVPGAFAYLPTTGTVLAVGAQTLTTIFTPTNTALYATTPARVTLQVNKATPVVTWPNPPAIPVGTALSAAQLNATANVAGTFAYTPGNGTVLTVGTHTVTVVFTPSDSFDYTPVTQSAIVTVTASGAGTVGGVGTPNDVGAAGTARNPIPITMTKVQGVVKPAAGHDSAVLSGVIPNVARGFSPAGKVLSVTLNGATVDFTLTSTGHAKSANGASVASLKFKPVLHSKTTPKSLFQGGNVSFTIALKAGTWSSVWGMNPNIGATSLVDLATTIVLDGTYYAATFEVKLTSKPKLGGSFKN